VRGNFSHPRPKNRRIDNVTSCWRIAAAAVLLTFGCSHTAPAREVVQLRRGAQNHLLLTAQVNGKPATLLVDTGSQRSLFRADRAAEFGIRADNRQLRLAGRMFPTGAVDELRVGGSSLGRATVGLYTAADIGGHLPGSSSAPADGKVGLDVLRQHRAVIDCRAGSISFNAAAPRPGGDFVRIPISDSRIHYVTVPCTLRARKGRMAIDTGAFLSTFDKNRVRELGLTTQPSGATARRLDGKVRALEVTRVEDLRIGLMRVPAQEFFVVPQLFRVAKRRAVDGAGEAEHQYRQDTGSGLVFGLLGNELLYQHHAIIDLGSMSLYLKPRS
jgi:predicted aspartyl protease